MNPEFEWQLPLLDSGECPVTSFECLGGRCLPLSWRCNGQVECLNEGPGLGSDEQGCNAEVETLEPPRYDSTPAEEDTYTRRNPERESEINKVADKVQSTDRSAVSEVSVSLAQPQTRKEVAVTPTHIEWPCGGLLQTFYGTFSPPAIQGPALHCVWTLDPQDSRPLRLDLQQLVLGSGDILTIYNGGQGKGDILKIVSFLIAERFIQTFKKFHLRNF